VFALEKNGANREQFLTGAWDKGESFDKTGEGQISGSASPPPPPSPKGGIPHLVDMKLRPEK
jgi:hypothetical protein